MRFADKRGFSLVEMLITTLIMSLVMVIVTSGSAVAQKLYRNTMAKADAQMVLSQIERYLRDDLSFADECEIDLQRSEYDSEDNLTAGAVTRYHKNGFWYELSNGPAENDMARTTPLYQNFLYKTFSATEAPQGEFQSGEQKIYEPLSTSNSKRLEEIFVSVPTITYIPGENSFQVSNLQITLADGATVIAGSASAGTPYLIIRALNRVRTQAKAETQES